MKKIIILFWILVSFNALAEVKIHEDGFSLEEVSSGSDHFYGRLYVWTAWKDQEVSKSFDVSPNPIKQAYEAGMQSYEMPELSEASLLGVFSGYEGEALADYYDTHGPIESPMDKDNFCFIGDNCYRNYSEVVFNTKVAVSIPSSFDIRNLKLSDLTKRASVADDPHMYSKISKAFARGFINPTHLAHQQIASHSNDEIYVSLLHFGSEHYQCTRLNKALNVKANGIISGILNPYRIYNINLFKELSSTEISSTSVIEGSPVKVFEQRIVSSTDLIKSSVSYIAFYEKPDGAKQMVLYSAVVSSSQVSSLLSMYVNGVDGESTSSILFSDGRAALNAGNIDLSPASGNCSKGLGPGVGRYIYGLANKIVNQ